MGQLPYVPTYEGNLSIFVGELRDQLFSSQEETAAHFYLDRSRISRYETGNSIPKIGYIAGLAQLLAKNEPQFQEELLQQVNLVIKHHYRRSRFQDWAALCHAAETYLTDRQAKSAKKKPTKAPEDESAESWETRLERRLNLPPSVPLVGVEGHLNRLSEVVTSTTTPWLICINGLGGIGKTALANALIRQPRTPERFHNVSWVSAKQQNYSLGLGVEEISKPVLNAEALTDALLEQLAPTLPLSQTPAQKNTALTELLKAASYLIVIDNLETLEDYQALLPSLLKLTNPTKFLLTSRHSLQAQANVFCLCLEELDQINTMDLIRQEAQERGISDVLEASETQLGDIYAVVGGNPLALKLVVGQVAFLSLSQVIENLKKARGKNIDDLYTFIYWQAWHMLDAASKKAFLMMPLAQDGTVKQLLHLTELEIEELNQALQQLAELSLVQVGGNLETRRYTIHRLTETFLLNEAIEWKTST